MGIFSHYVGNMDIPEADRPEYARQALELLRAGGMMSVDHIHLYDKSIHLLFPPELNDEGKAYGYYNYLDEESWETWGLDAAEGGFYSNKIGAKCFFFTIIAANILSTLWSKSYGAVTVDDNLVTESPYIAWINGVLGTTYTNWRATQTWTLKQVLHRENFCDYDHRDWTERMGHLPKECIDMGQTEAYFAACHLERYLQQLGVTQETIGTLTASDSITGPITYASLWTKLEGYHRHGGTLEEAKKYLSMSAEERRAAIAEDTNAGLLVAFCLTSPAVSVTMTAREFAVDFWSIWDEIGEKVPDMCPFTWSDPEPCPPLEPVYTHQFLELDPDDLAYYWTPDAPFSFSDEMNSWMESLRTELETISETLTAQEFLRVLVTNIASAETIFFRDSFYEFIHRQEETKVQQAVILLGRMGQREDENIRKYVAILGNPILRERVLGF